MPLILQDPYDTLIIQDGGQQVELKTLPLDLPNRQVPSDPRPTDKLVLRPLDFPDNQYAVPWRLVKGVELYEDRLLRAAKDLTQQGRLNDAFSVFAFLYQHHPKTSGLDQAYVQYLSADVAEAFRAGQLDEALMLLQEVQRRSPQQAGLERALARVIDQVLERMFDRRQFQQIRHWLAEYQRRFGDAATPVVQAWQKRLSDHGANLLRQAAQLREQGKFSAAQRVGHQARACWPGTPGLDRLLSELIDQYPVVHVGVRQPAGQASTTALLDWAAQRLGALVAPPLVDVTGFGDEQEGASYQCPLGKADISSDRRQMAILLNQSAMQRWNAYQISRLLTDRAKASMADGTETLLAESIGAVWPEGKDRVRVELRSAMLEGLAVLAVPLPEASRYERQAQEPSDEGLRYVLVDQASDAPREIVEQTVGSDFEAIEKLRAGQVDVIDRLWPFEAASLAQQSPITVGTYRFPTQHWLLINRRQPLCERREFRRALVYGIDREAILRDVFLGGLQVEGCQVISGPCPSGLNPDDPIGYGYDREVAVRPYDPLLARTLVQVSRANLPDDLPQGPAQQPVPLVLACPADQAMQQACRQIQSYLRRVGIECQTRWLEPGQLMPPDDQWDLLYADLRVREPLSDLRRLFGFGGTIAHSGPYVRLAERQVAQAGDWNAARQALRNLHRWAHDDVVVVPLWQIVDAFAYRDYVQGIDKQAVSLYQAVTQWRIRPPEPAELSWSQEVRRK